MLAYLQLSWSGHQLQSKRYESTYAQWRRFADIATVLFDFAGYRALLLYTSMCKAACNCSCDASQANTDSWSSSWFPGMACGCTHLQPSALGPGLSVPFNLVTAGGWWMLTNPATYRILQELFIGLLQMVVLVQPLLTKHWWCRGGRTAVVMTLRISIALSTLLLANVDKVAGQESLPSAYLAFRMWLWRGITLPVPFRHHIFTVMAEVALNALSLLSLMRCSTVTWSWLANISIGFIAGSVLSLLLVMLEFAMLARMPPGSNISCGTPPHPQSTEYDVVAAVKEPAQILKSFYSVYLIKVWEVLKTGEGKFVATLLVALLLLPDKNEVFMCLISLITGL